MSDQATALRLAAGDRAPDVTLLSASGQPVVLSDLWRVQPRLLAFLRHFG